MATGRTAIGNTRSIRSGPLSAAHAVFGKSVRCAMFDRRDFRAHVPDTACLKCHDAPAHNVTPDLHSRLQFMPHRTSGARPLSATANAGCAQCHTTSTRLTARRTSVAKSAGSITTIRNLRRIRPGATDPGHHPRQPFRPSATHAASGPTGRCRCSLRRLPPLRRHAELALFGQHRAAGHPTASYRDRRQISNRNAARSKSARPRTEYRSSM